MKWPSIGGYQLTGLRALFIAALVLDIIQLATGSGGYGLAAILALCAAWVLFKRVRAVLLWKLRNRLIVTYLFIAVVPIALILAFFCVSGMGLTAQFAGYLVGSAIAHREAAVETPARLLARELPADRMAIVQQLTATGAPHFEAMVTGGQEFRYPADATIQMPSPEWKNYTGIVYKDRVRYLMSLVTNGRNRSLILMPITHEVLETFVPGLGSIGLPTDLEDNKDNDLPPILRNSADSHKNAVAGLVPPKQNLLDFQLSGIARTSMADWNRPNSGRPVPVVIETRLSALLDVILSGSADDPLQQLANAAFYVIMILLGLAEVVSWYIGVSMTRTITGAVHNLYEGTKSISEGDFVHRIPVKGHDQLADLSRSFNKMSEQLEQFVTVTKEKERLQSEIAIASEVQTRLFPLRPPSAKTIEMLGVCHAARSVSGDYYDYFTAADGELALALGDVAGKGISAALLMASIQSIMRTQLSDASASVSPAHIVARLNRLLFANTSPEKYATFFFGLYNEHTRSLNYTNAGHLPPLLVKRDSYRLLDVTGSVVGAFPSLKYEEQSIPIGQGDLLVAYTDGITEPENAYGEDFGCERLADVAMRHCEAAPDEIVAKILEAVRRWDTSSEQADDMTLMVVRGIA